MEIHNHECPICLVTGPPLLVTPCNHRVCKPCLERVLSATTRNDPRASQRQFEEERTITTQEELEDALVAYDPTCGRCPFCRKCLRLFELKSERGLKDAVFIYEKCHDVWKTTLAGMSFQDRMRVMLLKFPSTDTSPPNLILRVDPKREVNVSFENGYFFHEKTNTFHGTVDLSKDDKCKIQERWDIIMQFASDYRYITHGAIVKRPVEKIGEESSDVVAHPLAGSWVVRWQRSDERGVDRNSLDAARLVVYGNSFTFQGITYHLNLGDDDDEQRVHFAWPSYLEGYVQVAESGIDLRTNPHGPGIGETIVWKVNSPRFFRIFWTRETIEKNLSPTRVLSLGVGGTVFTKVQHNREVYTPSYHSESLWGNVFVQGMTVGYASYHFVSLEGEGESGAYISYENIKCSNWPPLDDGSPVPSRVAFVNTSYDPNTRTFRGTIPWFDRYGTCWQGCMAWEYEMRFDREFLCIVSGEVKSIRNASHPNEVHSYGNELNYINCAILEKIRMECTGSTISSYIASIRDQLMLENVPPRTLALVMHASIGAFDHNREVFDYNR